MALPVFKVIPRRNHSFDVTLTGGGNRQKTVTGFGSQHEAEAWIIQAERMLHQADPRFQPPARHKPQR